MAEEDGETAPRPRAPTVLKDEEPSEGEGAIEAGKVEEDKPEPELPRPPGDIQAKDAPSSDVPSRTVPQDQAADPSLGGEEDLAFEKPVDELLLESGAVLLREGTVQIEPSFDYTHASSDRVNISGFTIFEAVIIGQIRVDDIQRDILTSSLAARFGVTDNIQLDGRVPWVYRSDTEMLGVGTVGEQERTLDGTGLGDVEYGLSYQPFYQDGSFPGVVLRLRTRIPTGRHPFEVATERVQGGTIRVSDLPTGSGFFDVAPGATFVWRSDPVVFFAGGSYTFGLERKFDSAGTIDPGDTVEFFGGLNVALSSQVSLNFSFVDQITGRTEQNGVEVPGSTVNDGRLTFGTSVGVAPDISLLTSAGIGLTDQSPDFQFTVSLPVTMDIL